MIGKEEYTKLVCKICGLPWIDIMCWCGRCVVDSISNCPGKETKFHKHSIDEGILSNEISRTVGNILIMTSIDLVGANVDLSDIAFLRYFIGIQILKNNEAISSISHPPQTNNEYYAFCSSLLKQYNTDFSLKHIKFHYIFDAKSEIHDFLNNYMAMNINENIVGMTYQCRDIFRSKGRTNLAEHSLFSRASYSDYFAIYISVGEEETNLLLFDLQRSKAHIICRTGEIPSIVALMWRNEIILSNHSQRTFEGSIEIKTDILLFKQFMSYYLQIPIFATRWMIKSPEKSVNDYIFRMIGETSNTSKINEYVKMNIEPIRKVNAENNIFAITFIGNDRNLLIPFLCSLVALLMKLENIHFCIGRESNELENRFIRNIQAGKFDIDRQTSALCSYRIPKKKAFITAFSSFTSGDFRKIPINHRPLAIHPPMVRRLNGTQFIDIDAILCYGIFFDSIDVNPIFRSGIKWGENHFMRKIMAMRISFS